MPSVPIRVVGSASRAAYGSGTSPLPCLLQTPSGLAIVEIQGTIHAPFQSSGDVSGQTIETTPIGRLEFPSFDPKEPGEGKWMKKVYLYVGKHQRLTSEIKKLAKPLAVIRKPDYADLTGNHSSRDHPDEELEIVDIVKFKLLFSGRPEPVGE